ncbi:putative thioesterase [Xenococcus sp. PCC 7305]|uniref:acyl-CoA thioesterase n=1 Tax=Xenococcus sp. PCC 7305 TaxID=102125 RepID=UPI0002AC55E1|nr:thioesterase family protein [Xenococcus sp. PCC 7305]ELS05175.1 putative thioesterase [Xenococcus sp. PCC 7305]
MSFSYHRTIYLSDTDAAGVIYFANALKICHEAYETWLSEIGISLPRMLTEKTMAIPIVHADIDFLRPIFCGDQLQINLKPKLISDNEFCVDYQIFKQESLTRPLAIAKTQHVCINPQIRSRIPLPQLIISAAKPDLD